MSKLLVFGLSPLPFEDMMKNFGPGIRVWQFIHPILDSGHEITLVANRIPGIYPEKTPPIVEEKNRRFRYIHCTEEYFRNAAFIQKIHDEVQPDALLAATIFAAAPLRFLKTAAPVWIDLFGHVMAEAQAKVFRYSDDTYLDHFRQHELLALDKGDIFSCVSRAQSFATVGELGLVGRLNRFTTGYEFCSVIPCAMSPEPLVHETEVLRNKLVPPDAFVVLWSGGFNTWTDTETLVAGLELAMEENAGIWFVSTGGQIDGHDEKTYPEFVQRVQSSPFSNRFILKGWIPKSQVPNYYFEADIGINIDRFMYEGMFGSKNRVLDWMRAGLPSLIGELCELSRDLPQKGLAYNFPLQDPRALAERLLYLADHRDAVRKTGERAKAYGLKHLTFEATTAVFRDWLEKPEKSPDHKNSAQVLNVQMGMQSDEVVARLEKELKAAHQHIRELERYVRHVEREFSGLEKQQLQKIRRKKPDSPMPGSPLHLKTGPVSVSVVIVSWNGEQYLPACLESIFSQNYTPLECIVVDNASRDGSVEYIRTHFPEVRLIQNKRNRGFSRAVNQGLELATGDVIILLNQDTIVLENWVQALVDELRSAPEIAIAGCKVLDPDRKTLQHTGGIVHDNGLTNHYGAGEPDQGQYDIPRDCDYVTGAAFAFKKVLLEQIGVFDTRFSPAYYEELDFCIRALRKNYRIRYTPEARIIHFESTSTGKFSSRFFYLYHRNRLKFIVKHYDLRSLLGKFRRFEFNWIRNDLPKEQMVPLAKAYLAVSPQFVWALVRELKRGSS